MRLGRAPEPGEAAAERGLVLVLGVGVVGVVLGLVGLGGLVLEVVDKVGTRSRGRSWPGGTGVPDLDLAGGSGQVLGELAGRLD